MPLCVSRPAARPGRAGVEWLPAVAGHRGGARQAALGRPAARERHGRGPVLRAAGGKPAGRGPPSPPTLVRVRAVLPTLSVQPDPECQGDSVKKW